MKKYDYLVVGAGLYGAVFAQQAKEKGKKVLVIDKRPHIAGNVYTEDVEGIHVHKYGAHIFHTNNKEVWDYITSFSFNRQDRKNKALLESLSIRTEIQNKVDQGTISEEEAQEYMHYIKTRTDKLIGLKTLPKQIVLQTNNQPNRNLLEDLKVKGLLTGGNENED